MRVTIVSQVRRVEYQTARPQCWTDTRFEHGFPKSACMAQDFSFRASQAGRRSSSNDVLLHLVPAESGKADSDMVRFLVEGLQKEAARA